MTRKIRRNENIIVLNALYQTGRLQFYRKKLPAVYTARLVNDLRRSGKYKFFSPEKSLIQSFFAYTSLYTFCVRIKWTTDLKVK